jgi:hypothetical protein
MEVEVEVEQLFERLTRDGADRTLTNVREHRIQQLTEQRCAYACRAVCSPHERSINPAQTTRRKGTTYTQE